MVSGSLSLPLLGFFSPFPHGTPSLSVTDSVFSLRSWSTLLQTGFLVPCLTQVPHHRVRFVSLTGLSPSLVVLSGTFCYPSPFFSTGYPHAALLPHFSWFGLLQFRSPLLSESLLISFPGLLRWFTSPSFAPPPYFIQVFAVYESLHTDYSIRISTALRICASPRGFSQLITSFFACQFLGIHHGPIFA